MQNWLMEIARCPITGQRLRLADRELVDDLRQQQAQERLYSHKGIPITAPFDSGLVNHSCDYFYRMLESIPALLPDEAIRIEQLRPSLPRPNTLHIK